MSHVITNNSIEGIYVAIDNSRWDDLAKCFHDQIEYERPGYPPFHGLARVMLFYQEERIVASGSHETEGIVIDGDRAACWGRFRGQHKNGSDIDELYADVYRMHEGRVRTRRTHFFRAAV